MFQILFWPDIHPLANYLLTAQLAKRQPLLSGSDISFANRLIERNSRTSAKSNSGTTPKSQLQPASNMFVLLVVRHIQQSNFGATVFSLKKIPKIVFTLHLQHSALAGAAGLIHLCRGKQSEGSAEVLLE